MKKSDMGSKGGGFFPKTPGFSSKVGKSAKGFGKHVASPLKGKGDGGPGGDKAGGMSGD
jgi:hypothetical protein